MYYYTGRYALCSMRLVGHLSWWRPMNGYDGGVVGGPGEWVGYGVIRSFYDIILGLPYPQPNHDLWTEDRIYLLVSSCGV